MKMKTDKKKKIQSKIVRPYFWTMITLAFVIIISFNLVMRFTMNRMAQDEIKESRETLKVLLRDELKTLNDDPSEAALSTKTRELAAALNKSLRMSALTTDTEILLLNQNGGILIPKVATVSDHATRASAVVSDKIQAGDKEGTFQLRMNQSRFLVSFEKYNETKTFAKAQYLVLIASQDQMALLTRRINFILIGILLVCVSIGLLVSRKIASQLTKPIQKVSRYAENLSKGDFSPFNQETNTEELHNLTIALNQMAESLKKKEQTKIDFLQNFSHDLRTPLMSIQGYAEGITTGVFTDPIKPAQVIASESIRLKHLVDQLITLSRLDAPEQLPTKSSIGLYAFLNLLIERYEGLATKDSKTITLQSPKGLTLNTDEELLDKILSNLISNALRYAKSNVTISTAESTEGIFIDVTDDGAGVPSEILPKLFNRFTKGEDGHFGLGLAIAEVASQKIGAKLTAKNTEKGATFTLAFLNQNNR